MKNSFINNTRRTLIKIGKILPFVVCGIVLISYAEDIYALFYNNYIEYYDGVYLNKPISWFIGNYFTYDIIMLFVLVVLSIAISTCVYNKLACAYLGFNLLEKSYLDFELEPTTIYIICIINIVITSFLCYKGVKQLMK